MKYNPAASLVLSLLLIFGISGSAVGEYLSVRSEVLSSESGGQSLGQFAAGTALEVLESTGSACRVRIGSGRAEVIGYVSSGAVSQGSGAGGDPAWIRSPYDSGTVSLRSRASDSYEVIGVLDDGENVALLGWLGGYCYIRIFSGRFGWVTAAEITE